MAVQCYFCSVVCNIKLSFSIALFHFKIVPVFLAHALLWFYTSGEVERVNVDGGAVARALEKLYVLHDSIAEFHYGWLGKYWASVLFFVRGIRGDNDSHI